METSLEPRVFPKYPHLQPGDHELWTKYLEGRPDDLLNCTYDVHLGPGVDVPSHHPENIRRMAIINSQYRMDVLCEFHDRFHIVEIKPEAGMTALGQALGYCDLFKRERRPELPCFPTVLTNFIKPGLEQTYANFNIHVWLVDVPRQG